MSLLNVGLGVPTSPTPTPAALAHLHGTPQTLCSSRGACSWDNPTAGRQKEVCDIIHDEQGQKQKKGASDSATTQMGWQSQGGQKGAQFRAREGDTLRTLCLLSQGLSSKQTLRTTLCLSSQLSSTGPLSRFPSASWTHPNSPKLTPQGERQRLRPPSWPAPRRCSISLQGPQSPPRSNGYGC